MTKKSRATLEAENKLLRKYKISESIANAVNTVIKWCALVWIVRYGYLSIIALAGQITKADFGVNLLSNDAFAKIVMIIFAFAGMGYGLNERRLRKNTVESLSSRVRELEEMLDDKRSSSQLTQRGDTHPKDA
jgi:hypothetical protein